MSNPVIVSCSQNSWKLVAQNTTKGIIKRHFESIGLLFFETYKMTGESVPSDLSTASIWGFDEDILINSEDPIDVYVYAINKSGKVKVEL